MSIRKTYIFNLFLMSVISLLTASCIFEPTLDPDAGLPGSGTGEEAEVPMIGIGVKIPTKAEGVTGEYQPGNYYENRIDIEKGDYRIYFFDEKSVFIERFIPTIITPIVESETYTRYNFHGKVPAGLVSGSTFKVVVIANWGEYNDALMIHGQTTIQDLCSAAWATFSMNDHIFSFEMKMPFFGVREYENQVFKVSDNENPITLPEQVDLLRGMARVEVIFNNPDKENLVLESVMVDRYNTEGYCAPIGVNHQDDYVHNDWSQDYVQSVHVLTGKRSGTAMNFRSLSTTENSETWMIYLLEYDHHNSVDASDYTTINLKFRHSETVYPIYFAEYVDGKTDNLASQRFDIERNNLYRFIVNSDLLVVPEFAVYVDPFTETPDQEIVM